MTSYHKLINGEKLIYDDVLELLNHRKEMQAPLQQIALERTLEVFGRGVYLRGLIEISSYCTQDCYYCGLRRSNPAISRYRLTEDIILETMNHGVELGFQTIVLQGGEDPTIHDEMLVSLISAFKTEHPEVAVTLSLGERSFTSLKHLKEAGADRYLLRHETIDESHFQILHPAPQTIDSRIATLMELKRLGYQVGAGMMIGSPYQTMDHLAKDILFLQEFRPHMIGLGPFIHQTDSPFKDFPDGSVDLSVYLLSILRLMIPGTLLPATTALSSLEDGGRVKGLLHGANVVMPNLSPLEVREKYNIYDRKQSFGAESAEGLKLLETELYSIGRTLSFSRGDSKEKLCTE